MSSDGYGPRKSAPPGDGSLARYGPAALLCVPIIAGLAWMVSLPPAHGPDEVAHLAYVEHVAQERSLPSLRFSADGGWSEGHQPPLYYLVAALLSPLVGTGWGVRWLSLVMGAGSVLAYYGLARRLTGISKTEAALLASATGLLPMFSFLTATVNNGAMVQLLVALVLWLGVEPWKWRGARSLWMGALVGGAVLSKMSGLFLIPYLICAWGRLYLDHSLSWKDVLGTSGRLLLVVTVVAGWWFWRNWLLYGDTLGWQQQMASAQTLVRRERLNPAYIYAVTIELWRSFWAAFGPSARQTAPPSVYILLSLLVAPGLGGLVASRWPGSPGIIVGAVLGGSIIAFLGWPLAVPWFAERVPFLKGFEAKIVLALVFAGILFGALRNVRWRMHPPIRRETGLMGLAVVLLVIGVYRYNVDFPQPQGRFVMPCAAPILYLIVLGWIALFGWEKRRIPMVGAFLLALLANALALASYAP
jgi:4-amino-4-deoxy-L-arabinose transferase-like glycosyltransferase